MYQTNCHKLSPNQTINEITLNLSESNTGTRTYHLSKYFAKLLSTLKEAEYTIKNTKYFVENNLLNVPLDKIHIDKIYDFIHMIYMIKQDFN